MNTVQAIKTQEQIATIRTLLDQETNPIFRDVFDFGVNVALRIQDLLSIKFSDLNLKRRELVLVESKGEL